MSYGVETDFGWKVYPFESKKELDTMADKDKYLASLAYIEVSNDGYTELIGFDGIFSTEELENYFIPGLRHALQIAKDLKNGI